MPTTLQSFKLLATHCTTAAAAATHSPIASPIRRPRRKTLRMLLRHDPLDTADADVRVRSKLKDLLLSSPPPPPIGKLQDQESGTGTGTGTGPVHGLRLRGASRFRRGGAAAGYVSSGFRLRLFRRAWRPVLLSIPE